jgi:peptidoglycan-associated lipoprotein
MWNATNAASVTIDGGIGTVEPSSSRTVSPSTSTTYTATATGAGGQRRSSSTRITVTEGSSTAIPPSTRTLRTEEFFATRVHDVFFDYDSYDLRDDARRTLDENARALSERAEIRFIIEGHADERGSERYNLALADRRAATAMQYLMSKGLSGDRIETISYGEERPMDQGHTEEAWAKNRRAHFVLK